MDFNGWDPFNLAFGTEVVIPIEIRLPTMWIECFDEVTNSDQLMAIHDLLKETQDRAHF